MSCMVFAYEGFKNLEILGYEPKILRYKLSTNKDDYHYLVQFKIKERLFTFDVGRHNNDGDVWTYYDYINIFKPKYIKELLPKHFKKIETMFNENNIDRKLYLINCGFNITYDEVVNHIKKECDEGIAHEMKIRNMS